MIHPALLSPFTLTLALSHEGRGDGFLALLTPLNLPLRGERDG